LAVTVAPVVADKPVAGLQENAFAPEAVRIVLPPIQIALVPLTETAGTELTATVTADVPEHPVALVPVTV
jgi:hypothetical protein